MRHVLIVKLIGIQLVASCIILGCSTDSNKPDGDQKIDKEEAVVGVANAASNMNILSLTYSAIYEMTKAFYKDVSDYINEKQNQK